MSFALRDINTVPPEDWVYYIPETNFTVQTKNYSRLYPEILIHCQSNHIQPPTEQEVIDYLCLNVHTPCYDQETRVPLINKMGLPFVRSGAACCGEKVK